MSHSDGKQAFSEFFIFDNQYNAKFMDIVLYL